MCVLAHLYRWNEGHPLRNGFTIRVTFISNSSGHIHFHLYPEKGNEDLILEHTKKQKQKTKIKKQKTNKQKCWKPDLDLRKTFKIKLKHKIECQIIINWSKDYNFRCMLVNFENFQIEYKFIKEKYFKWKKGLRNWKQKEKALRVDKEWIEDFLSNNQFNEIIWLLITAPSLFSCIHIQSAVCVWGCAERECGLFTDRRSVS